MNKKQQEKYNELFYYNCIEAIKNASNLDELKTIQHEIRIDKNTYVDLKKQLLIFVNAKININFSNKIKISEAKIFKPLFNTIKDEDITRLKEKMNTIKSNKLLFEFEGLINLLTDNNLIYNPLYKREDIIKYLLKFKSLNYFKVSYININDLNSKYSFLSVKKDKIKFYSKIQLINNCIVFNTLEYDNITVKVLYTSKTDLNKFIRRNNKNNKVLTDSKFNIHAIDYKSINKLSNKDKIIFYSYLKDNLLDKKTRRVLKDIKNSSYIAIDKKEEQEELKTLLTNILNTYLFNNECQASFEQLERYFYLDLMNYQESREIYNKIEDIKKQEDIFYNNSLEDIEINIEDYYYL